MKTYIHDVELAMQAMSLRSIEMIDRAKIQNIISSMYETYDELKPSVERLTLKTYIDKLEEAIK